MSPARARNRADRGAAEEELVRTHLPLARQAVNEIARRVPGHVNRDDLESAALLGLAQAARTFDPERGASFERHAATRIRGALLDELRGSDWASRSVRSRARRAQQAADELALRLGRTPTTEEVAVELGTDAESLHRLADDVHRATVLNYDSIGTEGDADDLLPSGDDGPDQQLVDRERRAYLADAVLTLPERLRLVVIAYFYEERPMQEIAAELGVTESRVSQLRAEALLLLKDGLNAHLDPDTLPAEPRPTGRVARRKAAYYAAIATRSDYRTRLDAAPRPVLERVAAEAEQEPGLRRLLDGVAAERAETQASA
jgi:RNA polymerase sigma factor for flagellar operon FliA